MENERPGKTRWSGGRLLNEDGERKVETSGEGTYGRIGSLDEICRDIAGNEKSEEAREVKEGRKGEGWGGDSGRCLSFYASVLLSTLSTTLTRRADKINDKPDSFAKTDLKEGKKRRTSTTDNFLRLRASSIPTRHA